MNHLSQSRELRKTGPRRRRAAPARPDLAGARRQTAPRHAPLTCFSPEVTGRALPLPLPLALAAAALRAIRNTFATFAARDRLFPMAAAPRGRTDS